MRVYRALLRLYPASFRAEYGRELAEAFVLRRGDARGPLALLVSIGLALADVIPNAAGAHWDILKQDLHYTSRALRRTPGFALTAILVVALGVGANGAAFSVATFVLLPRLPFAHPEALVKVWERTPGFGRLELSPANFKDWKAGARSFSAMGAMSATAVNLTGGGEPQRVGAAAFTVDVFPILGRAALLGRTFVASDTVAGRSVVLSYDLWQTHFGADVGVVGKTVELDGMPYSVIGVMPQDFRYPNRDAQLWTTLQFAAEDLTDRSNNYLQGVARLNDGATLESARAELAVIATQVHRQYPKETETTAANVYRVADELSDRNRLLLLALCGAALCILLLACANVANLLLVRAISREREIAVRTALGAGRERLLRQLVTESALLVLSGVVAGFILARLSVPMLTMLVPNTLPIVQSPPLNTRALLIAGLVVALVGIGFGVVPALRGATKGIDALRDGGRSGGGRRQRVRSVLVMIEVMASVVLLITCGLLMRAMWRLQSLDPGFRTENVLTLRTALAWPRYQDPAVRERFYNSVLSGVRSLPNVSSAAYVTGLPMAMAGGTWNATLPGQSAAHDGSNGASLRFATSQYFSTMSIPLQRGRDIAATDDANHPFVSVVSESFVKKYWPHQDPIGQRFNFALHERTVVGVVGDVRVRGFEQPSEPQVYLPTQQVESGNVVFYTPKDLVVRSTSGAAVLLPEIRRFVREADPQQPISNVAPLADVVATQTASRAAQLRVLELLAAIALLLATVGIHGLLSFAVSRRRQEIGVRVALGAQSSTILSMFLREGLLLGLGGLLPGVLVAYAAGRAMQALLVGIRPGDPVTIVAGVALCGSATLVGCLRPAFRASRVDPSIALRAE
ncbi:MAG: ABC transporter permease [Gemmatimonadaceae bacterium]